MRDLRTRIDWLDLAPVLVVLTFGLIGTGPSGHNQPDAIRDVDAFAYVLVVVAALGLVVRRDRPLVALGICQVCITVFLGFGYPFGPILLSAPVAVYSVVQQVDLRRAVAFATSLVLITTAVAAPRFLGDGDDHLALLVWLVAWTAVVTAPAAVGLAVRTRQQAAEEVQAEQARRAISEERLRMAQDLHDAVGHGLAVIAMQAGVALHVLDRDRERARESLEAIRMASRDALGDLRAELDELRTPPGERARRRPNPGFDEITVLVDRMRAGGLQVELDMPESTAAGVPDDVANAAYRIVQESLTNVLRHADGAQARVHVVRTSEGLDVEVTDTGRVGVLTPVGTTGASGGTGIAGMRSRAEALGGSLESGPRADGGFRVRAVLPMPMASPMVISTPSDEEQRP